MAETYYTDIIDHLTDIKGTGFIKDTDSLVDLAHTGSNGDTLETLSDQIEALALQASELTHVATSVTVTEGIETGNVADTQTVDGSYHQVQTDAVSNEIDYYFVFFVGKSRRPFLCTTLGRFIEGAAPYTEKVDTYVYNWVSLAWDHVSPPSGDFVNGVAWVEKSVNLNEFHRSVDGEVRIRFVGETPPLDAGSQMRIDWIYLTSAQDSTYLVKIIRGISGLRKPKGGLRKG